MYKKDLAELFKKYKSDNEIYHDLMQFRVREILLVTTIYDAFILEQEDRLSEQIFGEYYRLNLSTAPRITSASTADEAMELLQTRHFDMVILTMRISDMSPFELAQKIKSVRFTIPIFLLLYDNTDINLIRDKREEMTDIDKVFVWNRDSNIFLAMIKYIEDKINVVNDTKAGLVRVILLVENSIRYYSRYLPTLYTEIIKQTQRLIKEEHLDEMKKILRMHARPKVLMAVNYEEAVNIINNFKDYLLCVISDVKFPKGGKIDEYAGVNLVKYVKEQIEDLPTLLQSSDQENEQVASELKSGFINKNSETLSSDLTAFIFNNLGFGDFVFRDNDGNEIQRAKSMKQFKRILKKIPDESLVYHANRNHFSAWLMARGEIQIAKNIQPVKVTDFPGEKELRNYLIDVFEKVDYQNIRGKVIEFDESIIGEENLIVRLSEGSLGGKGRGIAFINTLIQNTELDRMIPEVDIKIPGTVIIGTEEYDYFIGNNNLDDAVHKENNSEKLKKRFLESSLSKALVKKLKMFVKHISSPVAVRSSGLFEDSLTESFSGVYQTYLLPNNNRDIDVRLKQLQDAVKLVYASVFTKSSRSYFEAINYKVEDEKMGVVIQEVVGSLYGSRYYPHISGIAQSFNYYPISHMKPVDGIAVIGVGLGKYVIDGEKAYRFCPKYPKLEITPPEVQIKNSQDQFYAVDMTRAGNGELNLTAGEESTLVRLNISDAEKDGTLDPTASVWDNENKKMKVGLDNYGPRVINFARILKYDYFPLAKVLETILDLVKNAMGTPVEIEFAVKLPGEIKNNSQTQKNKSARNKIETESAKRNTFYILQIKPLIRNFQEFSLNVDKIKKEELLLYTERGMGNGKIDDIYDIIYANPEKFDKTKTPEMPTELEMMNELLRRKKRKYILIG
ncbi:MAG: PEP/pyruvate-binding domain-containing protein, partial [Ignavibacteria bacterium]